MFLILSCDLLKGWYEFRPHFETSKLVFNDFDLLPCLVLFIELFFLPIPLNHRLKLSMGNACISVKWCHLFLSPHPVRRPESYICFHDLMTDHLTFN
ncbi:hypothetical protein OIU77_023806 [Salix suchowensis]|uniref:Uncharacterized protein n=1 Tax=Salix suchowensis TaxID=1278906 RepID=A0ABQ9C8U7_9ROSI|nr:hypothetical protein OIU77_023806 [Salix suchowensis]